MRQWHVPPGWLCNKHLLGEHVEHHMFAASVRLNKSVAGYVKDGLLWPSTLESRHRALVKEMDLRGMKHTSPMLELHEVPQSIPATFNGIENARELQRRCPECRRRIEVARGVVEPGIPHGGDYYEKHELAHLVYISGKLVGSAQSKIKAIALMEKKRKEMRKDGSIWL